MKIVVQNNLFPVKKKFASIFVHFTTDRQWWVPFFVEQKDIWIVFYIVFDVLEVPNDLQLFRKTF